MPEFVIQLLQLGAIVATVAMAATELLKGGLALIPVIAKRRKAHKDRHGASPGWWTFLLRAAAALIGIATGIGLGTGARFPEVDWMLGGLAGLVAGVYCVAIVARIKEPAAKKIT